ncbi:MAG: putative glycoside hydrolase [Patescibacteria group bacterium]
MSHFNRRKSRRSRRGGIGLGVAIAAVAAVVIFLWLIPGSMVIVPDAVPSPSSPESSLPVVPEAQEPVAPTPHPAINGFPKQTPLPNPPEVVKAIYITSWVAGGSQLMPSLIKFVDEDPELNGVVVDIKDYSGYVAYKTGVPEIAASGAEKQLRIADINKLIYDLHAKDIYVVGRVSVFQDPVLAKARPEWALHSSSTGLPAGQAGKLWLDNKGLAWMDVAAQPVWDYHVALAKDALSRGFDEINFDYIRFPSDGNLDVIQYPFWDGKTSRSKVIRGFFEYLRTNLPGAKISVDLFGLATAADGDLGIGQLIEDAYASFDFVSPMVYPSHYAAGFIGYKNPAAYPYEVIKYSMEKAVAKRDAWILKQPTSTPLAAGLPAQAGKLRPWLQAFDLGATYNRSMIDLEIKAVEDVLKNASSSGQYTGWLLWDPSNRYQGYKR